MPMEEYCPHCEANLPFHESSYMRYDQRRKGWSLHVEKALASFYGLPDPDYPSQHGKHGPEGTTVVDGVVRWKSNGRVPPEDILAVWHHLGLPFDYEASVRIRDKEEREFLEEYRRVNKGRKPSAEERAEARAAMGPGVKMVNVITGDEWVT